MRMQFSRAPHALRLRPRPRQPCMEPTPLIEVLPLVSVPGKDECACAPVCRQPSPCRHRETAAGGDGLDPMRRASAMRPRATFAILEGGNPNPSINPWSNAAPLRGVAEGRHGTRTGRRSRARPAERTRSRRRRAGRWPGGGACQPSLPCQPRPEIPGTSCSTARAAPSGPRAGRVTRANSPSHSACAASAPPRAARCG